MLATTTGPPPEAVAPQTCKVLSDLAIFFRWLVAPKTGTATYLALGLFSYVACIVSVCNSELGDSALTAQYATLAPREAYSWAMIAFGTAFCLNVLSLIFEHDPSKKQLVLLACYINMLAASSGYLSWSGHAPVFRDIWGGGFCLCRVIMWLHTTPAMVYLLSLISDFEKSRLTAVMMADPLMILTSIVAHLAPDVIVSGIMYIVAFSLFGYVIKEMWSMFDSPINDAPTRNAKDCLKVLRLTSVGLWFTLPATFLVAKLGGVSVSNEEWMWTIADFLGKVTFSSSLLYSNFMTMEQRRLVDMRCKEQTNRMQVILELKDLVTQKQVFMSSMSHELRTPLNGIIGMSESLLVGAASQMGDDVKDAVRTIKSSGLRLLTIINNVLDADSARVGQLVVKQEKVDIAEVVQDVVQICQPLVNTGVRLKDNLTSTLPAVKGDRARIVQILYNLIGNACKFTEAGQILLRAAVCGDHIKLTVQDSGTGIAADHLKQLTTEWQQEDSSVLRYFRNNSGLGLSLVQQLVEAHGGSVTIESTQGKEQGTSVTFTLPLWDPKSDVHRRRASIRSKTGDFRQAHSFRQPYSFSGQSDSDSALRSCSAKDITAGLLKSKSISSIASSKASDCAQKWAGTLEHPAGEAVSEAGGKAPRFTAPMFGMKRSQEALVLSVDDDPVNQLVISSLLTPAGYKVIQAMDGQEALTTLQESEELPDLILLDVMMPGMSGYDVCRKLRTMPPFNCVPIIMVSAKSKGENIVEGLVSGSNDYIVKPYTRVELLARIAAHTQFRDEVYRAALADAASPIDKDLTDLLEQNGLLQQQLDEGNALCTRLQSELDTAQADLERKSAEVGAGVAVAMESSVASPSPTAADSQWVAEQRMQVSRLTSERDEALVQQQQTVAQLEAAEAELLQLQQDKRSMEVELGAAKRCLQECTQRRTNAWHNRPDRHRFILPRGSMPLLSCKGLSSQRQSLLLSSSCEPLVLRLSDGIRLTSQHRGSYSGSLRSSILTPQVHPLSRADWPHAPIHGSTKDPVDKEDEDLLAQLLRDVGLEWLLPKFLAEDITPQLLLHVDDEGLKQLGVSSIGARMRLRLLVANHFAHAPSAGPS